MVATSSIQTDPSARLANVSTNEKTDYYAGLTQSNQCTFTPVNDLKKTTTTNQHLTL